MTFRNDDGEEIEYSGKFSLTKGSTSILNGTIKGNVSINFIIENTSVNRKVLGFYGPMSLNAVVKKAFNRIRNGTLIDRGYIIVQGDSEKELECFYLGGNASWIQATQGLITNLDLYRYRSDWSIENIQLSPTEGIIYCLADWYSDSQKGSPYYTLINAVYTNNPNDVPISIPDFYPCFYLHTLVEEIAVQNGFKLEGNLFDDVLFNSMVIGPYSAQLKRNITVGTVEAYQNGAQAFTGGVEAKFINFNTEVADPDNLFSSGTYTANKKTSLLFFIDATPLNGAVYYDGSNYITIKRNGVNIFRFNSSTYYRPMVSAAIKCNVGDTFEIYGLKASNGNIRIDMLRIYESVNIWPDDTVEPYYFLPPLKSIDVLKFCFNYFGCSVYYDDVSNVLTANIIDSFKREDALNWSDYILAVSSDYENKATNNYLKWSNPFAGTVIEDYNKINKQKFAEGNITTDYDSKEDKTIIKFQFPSFTLGKNINGHWLCNVPLAVLENTDNFPIGTYNSTSGVRVIYNKTNYLNSSATDEIFASYSFIRVYSGGEDKGIHLAPLIITGVDLIASIYSDSITITRGQGFVQSINFIQSAKILIVKRATSPSEISSSGTFTVVYYDNSVGGSSTQLLGTIVGNSASITSFNLINFTKPMTGYGIDSYRENMAIDNTNIGTLNYSDPTIRERYLKFLESIVSKPPVRVRLLIPEAVFHSFKFDSFVFFKTNNLTGYFYFNEIENYVDGSTPVTIPMFII